MRQTVYLAHHGIKGQKWGVRRFQNKDGSLTPAGKKRLNFVKKSYVNRKYRKHMTKTNAQVHKDRNKYIVEGMNRAIRDINKNGSLDKFYTEERRNMEYRKLLGQEIGKEIHSAYLQDKHYKKAQVLVEKYEMEKWSKFVKGDNEQLNDIRDHGEKYDWSFNPDDKKSYHIETVDARNFK